MPSERKPFQLNDFSGGQAPDYNGMSVLPQWDLLENVWLDGQLKSRPFTIRQSSLGSTNGYLARTHDNKLAWSDGTFLYINFAIKDVLNGGLRLKADISRKRTLFANGGNQIQYWNGTTHATITGVTGVYALATVHGFEKQRVCYVSSLDKHTLRYSTFDIADFGTQIIDDDAINDAWTDGGAIYDFPYEIIDILEFRNVLFVFTRKAIYTLTPEIGVLEEEDIFLFDIQRFQEVDLYNISPVKTTNTIYFMSKQGLSAFGLTEFNNFSNVSILPMPGIRDTILRETDPESGAINYDVKRNLLYLAPSSSSGKVFVAALGAEGAWFQWNTHIQSAESVNAVTYAVLKNNSNLYRLEDNVQNTDQISVRIHSGLSAMDNNLTKKHARTIYADISSKADHIEYVLDVDNKPVTDKLLNKRRVKNISSRYNAKSGQRGEQFKLLAEFGIEGTTWFREFGIEYLEKPPRKNLKT